MMGMQSTLFFFFQEERSSEIFQLIFGSSILFFLTDADSYFSFFLCNLSPRVHEFNVEMILAAFIPYHDTPQFARMLQILKLE